MKKIITMSIFAIVALLTLGSAIEAQSEEQQTENETEENIEETIEVPPEAALGEGVPPVMTMEPLDEETEEEIELIAESTVGSKIRILQLEHAILKLKITAETITSYIKSKSIMETENLEAMVEELDVLYMEAQGLDPASPTRVEDFVYIKNDARSIAKEFRMAVKDNLSATDRQELKTLIRTAISESEELATIKEEIKDTLQSHNAERVRNMLGKLGANNDQLIKRVREGNASFREVAEELKNHYQALTPEEKRAAKQELKAQIEKKTQEIREKTSKVRDEYLEKAHERIQERAMNMSAENREQIMKRLEIKVDTIEERQENRNERIDSIQERVNDRIDARQDRITGRINASADAQTE